MIETEIKTVDTILDQGVRVPIPAPFFLKWLGVRQVNIIVRTPVISTLLLVSKIYLQLNVTDDFGNHFGNWIRIFNDNAEKVSRIVAVGMLRSRSRCWLFTRPLAWYLRGTMTNRDMASVASMLVTLGGVQDFLNTIRFVATMKITAPRNLSQDTDGS